MDLAFRRRFTVFAYTQPRPCPQHSHPKHFGYCSSFFRRRLYIVHWPVSLLKPAGVGRRAVRLEGKPLGVTGSRLVSTARLSELLRLRFDVMYFIVGGRTQ